MFEALVAAEQRAKDGGIRQQYITGAIGIRRHPKKHVELRIACFDAGMRPGRVDRLFGEHVAVVENSRHTVHLRSTSSDGDPQDGSIQFIGTATTVLIQFGGYTILTDPIFCIKQMTFSLVTG